MMDIIFAFVVALAVTSFARVVESAINWYHRNWWKFKSSKHRGKK